VLLDDLARTSAAVAEIPARSGKVAALAGCLARAAPEEVALAVAYLSGELPQRKTGVGYASLRDLPEPAGTPTLTLLGTDAAIGRIAAVAGQGAQRERRRLLVELMGQATAAEQRLLRALLTGELRQGALDAVVLEAAARAAGVPAAEVRRAVMLRGASGPVVEAVLREGAAGLDQFRLVVGRPLRPMLAHPVEGMDAALERVRPAAVEWKLDGIRIQVHRDGDEVAVFTRTLDDITGRVPEVVDAVRALPVTSTVLDGEAIALRADGRPLPFQVTASRVGSRVDVARMRASTPLSVAYFDALHVNGADLIGEDTVTRASALASAVPQEQRVPRTVTDEVAVAARFLDDALARGHEGVMVKALDAPYEAGRRGAGWLKVKPRHTLDLVVLAAEWGHGRRRGWLSNLHLGARDPASGGFVMLGKTFKGLTDAMLTWQTERLLALRSEDDGWVVRVRPELVVEVAFDGVQTSPRYPAGMALRFARVLRHRPDKAAAEADTVDAVRAVHRGAG